MFQKRITRNRFIITSVFLWIVLAGVAFFSSFNQVQALVYNTSTANAWCTSSLKAKLNSTNSVGWYWIMSDKDRYFLESDDCGFGKVTLINNSEWTTIKETYKTAIGTSSYADSRVTKFWTSTPVGLNTNAYAVTASTGAAASTSVTTTTGLSALPVLMFQPQIISTSIGTGAVTNPYELILYGRPLNSESTSGYDWCNSTLLANLNDNAGAYLKLFGDKQKFLQNTVCGNKKIDLIDTTTWSAAKATYKTAVTEQSGSNYAVPYMKTFWTKTQSGTQAYYINSTTGDASLNSDLIAHGVLPVIQTGNGITTTGAGVIGNPYEVLLQGRSWYTGTNDYTQSWCNSTLLTSLNSTSGGYIKLFGSFSSWLLAQSDCNSKITLLASDEWTSGVKTAYRTGINGSDTGRYTIETVGNFWTKTRVGKYAYWIASLDGSLAQKAQTVTMDVLPVVQLTTCLQTTSAGAGTIGNPYELESGCGGDSTAPTGGSVTFSNATKKHSNETVTLTVSDGTDSGLGINTSSRALLWRKAKLTDDTCGSYGDWSGTVYNGTYPTITVTNWEVDRCYQFAWQVADKAGNVAMYTNTSNVIKTLAENTFSISSVSVGTVIKINEIKFVKVNAAGLFMALDSYN